MNAQGFDKIANNCDILLLLYKYLNFSEQLRLSCVSVQLKGIFEDFIWKEDYRVMTITDDEGDYVVTGGTGSSPLILEHAAFQEFLAAYEDNVVELTVKDLKVIDIGDIQREFRNLRKLRYEKVQLPVTHLSMLGKKCRNLQELQLSLCSIGSAIRLVMGKTPTIKSLSKLKNLRRLCIENDRDSLMPYAQFRQVVTRLKLERFKMNAIINPDAYIGRKKRRDTVMLKELEICTTFDPQEWPSENFSSYLTNFENLSSLTLRLYEYRVTDASFAAIAHACTNLQLFSILDTRFAIVKPLPVPPKVTEFSLERCKHLSCDNLKALLAELKCSKFSSRITRYEGEFQDFEISPHIRSLDVDDVNTKILKFSNIKELTWYDESEYENEAAATDNPLASCLNLEKLNIRSGSIPLSSLLQLSFIHSLNISESMPFLNWSYVTALLKHPPLQEFVINGQLYRSLLCERSDVPVEGFTTNIKILKISFAAFQGALSFWLDLFQRNENLTLICYNFKNFEEFLRIMIDHDNFPTNLRTMKIWGFALNCSNLRRHFDATIDKFVKDASYLRLKYESDGDLYRLILCRQI